MPLSYNREKSVDYALKWAFDRNPLYYNFDFLGGDCTNFASQCLYAGCKVMNFTRLYGWYYKNINDRTPSWTGVNFLYEFLINNKSNGPAASVCLYEEILPADLIQLKRNGTYTHTLVVTKIDNGLIYVSAHTYDCRNKPLTSYIYDDIRYLHIV